MLTMACLATAAAAQVDCSNPDNLCTGDPCTITDIEVDTPCVVDFGARALVIRGRVRVPAAGTLDLTAASIEVQAQGSVNGSREDPGGVAADLALRAAGAIVMEGRLLASGGNAAGSITVEAGDTLTVAGSVRSNAPPAGGSVFLRGDAGVRIDRFVRASGATGGSIVVQSTVGDVTVAHDLRAEGAGTGGMILIQAVANVTVSSHVSVQGKLAGGAVYIGCGVDCVVDRKVRVRSNKGVGGMLTIAAGSDVIVNDDLDARGKVKAGTIEISALGQVSLLGRADVDLRGDLPGASHIEGASASVAPGVRWNARTKQPGSALRFVSHTSDLTLDGAFETTSGTIEGMAAGNLTAGGRFRAGPDGCIALSAGGTLDTTGGLFDETIVADCPGSRSGASLDGDA
jgi:hypothetical protein